MPGVEKGKRGVLKVCSGQFRPIAYAVRFKNGHCVGVVEDIIDLEYVCQLWIADELSIPLLRHNAGEADQLETVVENHTVHHRIPLVPEFILDVDCKAKSITVKLPAGLIKLGREELYIRVLKRELKPYIAHLPNRFREKIRGERELPRYTDLRKEGRTDLVSLIKQAGGLAKVAQTLGCRTAFRPRGYFQDLDNLDWDLSCFIASGWVKLPTALDPLITAQPDSDEPSAASEPATAEVPDSWSQSGATANQQKNSSHLTGKQAKASVIVSEAEAARSTPSAELPVKLRIASTTTQTEAHLSLDCGDELLQHEDRELCELDRMVTDASDEYMSMATITHAGKVERNVPSGGNDGNVSFLSGYDAPDERYAVERFEDASSPSSESDGFDEFWDDPYRSADEGSFEEDDEYETYDPDEEEWPKLDEVGSASSPVGEWYFYNTITDEVSLEEPQVPSVHRVGQALVRVEDESQRYMPRQASLEEAGRNDLLNAIRMHGGFQVVADVLQRQRLFIRRPVVNDRDVILRKVCRVQQTLGLSPDEFPTREQFEACQMPQVVCWITSAGGFRKMAVELGMRTRRMMSQITPEEVALQLKAFMQHHPPPAGEEKLTAQGDLSKMWRYLPSLQHLRDAGCENLALKVKRSNTNEIARMLGVEARKRGWPRGRPRKLCLSNASEVDGATSQAAVIPKFVVKADRVREVIAHAVERSSRIRRAGTGIRAFRRNVSICFM